jgi:O-antigen ligase
MREGGREIKIRLLMHHRKDGDEIQRSCAVGRLLFCRLLFANLLPLSGQRRVLVA